MLYFSVSGALLNNSNKIFLNKHNSHNDTWITHFIMLSSLPFDSHIWGFVSCRRVLAGQVPRVSGIGIGLYDKNWRESKHLPVDSLLWVKASIKHQCNISNAINQIAYGCHLSTCLKELLSREFRILKETKPKQDREISIRCEKIGQSPELGND